MKTDLVLGFSAGISCLTVVLLGTYVPYYSQRITEIRKFLDSELVEFEKLESEAWTELKLSKDGFEELHSRQTRQPKIRPSGYSFSRYSNRRRLPPRPPTRYRNQCQCETFNRCPPGPPGPPGLPGTDGVPGNPGPDGRPGVPGIIPREFLTVYPGCRVCPQGPKGIGGPKGAPGPNGRRGLPGPRGRSGIPGKQGLPGPPGLPGPTGQPGQSGNTGIQGLIATRGIKGAPGRIGLPGPIGPKGDRGRPGRSGSLGLPGNHGYPGDGGRRGVPGPPGPKGHYGTLGIPGRDAGYCACPRRSAIIQKV